MTYRDLAKLLRQAGFTTRPGKGDHEVWTGPNNARTVIVHARECSPAVTKQALEAIATSKEGNAQ